jgi:hypothetical protein
MRAARLWRVYTRVPVLVGGVRRVAPCFVVCACAAFGAHSPVPLCNTILLAIALADVSPHMHHMSFMLCGYAGTFEAYSQNPMRHCWCTLVHSGMERRLWVRAMRSHSGLEVFTPFRTAAAIFNRRASMDKDNANECFRNCTDSVDGSHAAVAVAT